MEKAKSLPIWQAFLRSNRPPLGSPSLVVVSSLARVRYPFGSSLAGFSLVFGLLLTELF